MLNIYFFFLKQNFDLRKNFAALLKVIIERIRKLNIIQKTKIFTKIHDFCFNRNIAYSFL